MQNMRDKMSLKLSLNLRIKIIITFYLFNAFICGILAFMSFNVLKENLFTEFKGRALNIAQLGTSLLDRNALIALARQARPGLPSDLISRVEHSTEFKIISDQLNEIRNSEKVLIKYAYIIKPSEYIKSGLFIADADTLDDLNKKAQGKDTDGQISHFSGTFDAADFPVYQKATIEKKLMIEEEFVYDKVYNVNSITAYAPITNKETGEFIALLCIDVADINMAAALKQSTRMSAIIIAGAFILSMIVSIMLGGFFTRGIVALNRVVNRFGSKDFSVRAEISTNDEIGRLGQNFNVMAQTIQNYAGELEGILDAYNTFVPRDFLNLLGKESIMDIKLGDHVEKLMSVFSLGIRSFQELTNAMTPDESIKFINSYLKRLGPIVRDNQGFIEKYKGDAIMAVFPESHDGAVMTALTMVKAIEAYNNDRGKSGYPPLSIGIGIHSGVLMLGTIGEDDRMDSNVITDTALISERLEELTAFYHSSIILSKQTFDLLMDKSLYDIRYIGKTQYKEKGEPIMMYEVFNCDPTDMRVMKKKSRDHLEVAINLYYESKYDEALKILRTLRSIYASDILIDIYTDRCEKHKSEVVL